MVDTAYTRPMGSRDRSPGPQRRVRRIEAGLLDVFGRYGFEQVDVPTLEYLDLYAPERIGSRLYHSLFTTRMVRPAEFPSEGEAQGELVHDAALRPDFTTPVARMFVERLLRRGERRPAPTRWCYAGSVFRNHGPADRLEFRQVGVELMGTRTPYADLEVLRIAVDAMEGLQVPGWSLSLSHADLLRGLVGMLDVGQDHEDAVVNGLAQLAGLRSRLERQDPGLATWLVGARRVLGERARVVLGATLDAAEVEAALARDFAVLQDGSDDDLVFELPALLERLLGLTWRGAHGLADTQVARLRELSELGTTPAEFFSEVDDFLAATPYGGSAADRVRLHRDQFRALVDELREAAGERLRIRPEATRGLAYYTGVAFELHAPTGLPDTLLGGGGRYAELPLRIFRRARETAALRARGSTEERVPLDPAALTGVGCALRVDRLDAALSERDALTEADPVDVDVLLATSSAVREGMRLAARLRGEGLRVRCALPDSGGGLPALSDQQAASEARWQVCLDQGRMRLSGGGGDAEEVGVDELVQRIAAEVSP